MSHPRTSATVVPFEPVPYEDSPLQVNDIVVIHPDVAGKLSGIYFKITSVPSARSKNYCADPVRGGRGLRGARIIFVKVTGPAQLAEAARQTAAATDAPDLHIGCAVRFKHPHHDNQHGPFVVIKVGIDGKHNLAKLGGDGGRYFRGVNTTELAPIPTETITITE
ncbi:MAG: hypothetical protein ACRDRO_04035 [Pseudonocardiaceae bacterium]